MNDLAERLKLLLIEKGLKASDVVKSTGITPPVMSRYLSGKCGASATNIFKLSQYLNVSADWLQNGSEATESLKRVKRVHEDKDKIIAVQGELITNLQKQIKELEKTKQKPLKNPTNPKKQKVGFLKKHKPQK